MFKFQYLKNNKKQQVREVFFPDYVFYFEIVWPEIKVRDCV